MLCVCSYFFVYLVRPSWLWDIVNLCVECRMLFYSIKRMLDFVLAFNSGYTLWGFFLVPQAFRSLFILGDETQTIPISMLDLRNVWLTTCFLDFLSDIMDILSDLLRSLLSQRHGIPQQISGTVCICVHTRTHVPLFSGILFHNFQLHQFHWIVSAQLSKASQLHLCTPSLPRRPKLPQGSKLIPLFLFLLCCMMSMSDHIFFICSWTSLFTNSILLIHLLAKIYL